MLATLTFGVRRTRMVLGGRPAAFVSAPAATAMGRFTAFPPRLSGQRVIPRETAILRGNALSALPASLCRQSVIP
jgi:hypothetical protein